MSQPGTPGAILTLLRDGPRQAQDLAGSLGIDTSAVRRHLESMRAEGLVAFEDVVQGPGRPKKMYRLTTRGEETFPRDYALLLSLLMRKLADTEGKPTLQGVVAAIARDLGATVRQEAPEARLSSLLRVYNDLGFEATFEPTESGVRLVQRNCIVLRTAREDPGTVCDCFDEGIMRAALPGAKVALSRCMATGDSQCHHEIDLTRARAKSR